MYIPLVNKIFKSIQDKKSDRLLYYPSKISIETGNVCNLRCPLCPTNASEEGGKKGFLTLDNFKIIFSRIEPFARTIDLFNWGEPFLNKDIGEMIKYAKTKKPHLRIFIDSNLNVINNAEIDAVVRYGLDSLKVSCDGATQGVYEKYRVGGNINQVIENMNKLLAKKRKLGSDKPRIIWKYLVFKHNQSEIEKAREMAGRMGVEFEVSGMRINCGREIFETVEESVKRDQEWIPDEPKYNNYKELKGGKAFCEKPWRTLTINWDGEVVPCGAIYDCQRYSFGNLLEQDFGAIWNGERFVLARRIISGKVVEYSDIICAICKKNGYQFF